METRVSHLPMCPLVGRFREVLLCIIYMHVHSVAASRAQCTKDAQFVGDRSVEAPSGDWRQKLIGEVLVGLTC